MGPERVDDNRGSNSPATSKPRFEELLARRKRPQGERPSRPRAAPTAAAAAKGTRLSSREASRARHVRGAARSVIEAGARTRQQRGTEATLAATGRLQGRARALAQAEGEPAAGEVKVRRAAGEKGRLPGNPTEAPFTPPAPLGPSSASEAGPLAALADAGPRAERALALVEKIELLLRSGRPALSVSLRTREPARVEVQRVGRASVALRLASARPMPPEEIELLKTALATRGLTLHALQWVPLPPAVTDRPARSGSSLTPGG